MIKKMFVPKWTEVAPPKGSYRSVFKYGDPHTFKHPSAKWYEMIKEEFSMTDEDFRTKKDQGLGSVALNRPNVLESHHREGFEAIVGKENVTSDDYSRVKYALGKTSEEMMELRKGIVGKVADLVVHPRTKEDVQHIVAYCNENRVPVYAFGAGSSVNFGVRPEKGGISLVMSTHMNKVLEVNEANQTARVQPGLYGPAYEEALHRAPEL